MITAEELRESTKTNKNTIIPQEVADYCLKQLEKEMVNSADKGHCSYWFDSISDKTIQEKWNFCRENNLRSDILDIMETQLTRSKFSVERKFNGISVSW